MNDTISNWIKASRKTCFSSHRVESGGKMKLCKEMKTCVQRNRGIKLHGCFKIGKDFDTNNMNGMVGKGERLSTKREGEKIMMFLCRVLSAASGKIQLKLA